MVGSATVAWQHGSTQQRREEVVLPPLEVGRTSAKFLLCGLLKMFDYICPMLDLMKETEAFQCVQWLVVADSATANLKALPRLFAFLQRRSGNSLAWFSPCLLHQCARLLVMNLERQGLCSHLPVFLVEPGPCNVFLGHRSKGVSEE